MRALRSVMAVVSGLALLPFLIILVTVGLATVLGCDVNESGPQVCMAFGSDWGGALSGMLAAGWLGLLTIPLLMGVFVVWLTIEAYVWRRKRRKERRRAAGEAAA